MNAHFPLAGSRGNVLLLPKANPKGIKGIADLARDDISLFLSNPKTETVSYTTYINTLRAIAARLDLALDFLDGRPHPRVLYGESIHHREAPQAVAAGDADAAVVFHHLALRLYADIPGDIHHAAADGGRRARHWTGALPGACRSCRGRRGVGAASGRFPARPPGCRHLPAPWVGAGSLTSYLKVMNIAEVQTLASSVCRP
jgi:hypothetical protein